ncbi:MAG TPA: acylphosphatase [Thermoplasmatales archaeon]|nr:MAG: acylphosphatase [Thermoplasmata archaeon]RLF32066.1 MAG: acylphosphatase [Thermoplasmata archaeon]RLF57161.1 MAG: acylphosphatase [Thermoplasmata archaeon]HDN50998.1 acylphosphatase [Thermoplasmatales archaeon]
MKRTHVFISGRVQGVWFRAHTREKAEELGISGWVRNLPDGRVEAVFEGEDEKVDEMVKWCHRGPPLSRVEKVDVEYETPKGEKGFTIRY